MVYSNFVLYDSSCMNNCLFCSSKEMGDIENNIKKEFSKLQKLKSEGYTFESVEISGNDPVEYSGLSDIALKIKRITNTPTIMLSTHGRNLKDPDFLARLIKSGVNRFRFPIYGHCAQIHDSITRSKGSFDDLMEAFKNIMKHDVYVIVTFMIVKQNQKYLKEAFYFLSRMSFANEFNISFAGYDPNHYDGKLFLPNLSDLRNDLTPSLEYFNTKDVYFRCLDMPFCLSAANVRRCNQDIPFQSYTHFNLKNYERPNYLQKTKFAGCASCKYDSRCGGVFRTYYESGLFDFQPVK